MFCTLPASKLSDDEPVYPRSGAIVFFPSRARDCKLEVRDVEKAISLSLPAMSKEVKSARSRASKVIQS